MPDVFEAEPSDEMPQMPDVFEALQCFEAADARRLRSLAELRGRRCLTSSRPSRADCLVDHIKLEVSMWAALHSQSCAKTIIGALGYQIALNKLLAAKSEAGKEVPAEVVVDRRLLGGESLRGPARNALVSAGMLPTGLCQFYHNIHYGRWYCRSDVIAEDEMIWMYCFGGATRIGTHRAATPVGAVLRAVPAQGRMSLGATRIGTHRAATP